MRAYGPLIHEIAREHAGRWQHGRPFPLHRTMQEISLEVILQAVLGMSEPETRRAFQAAVLATIAALKPSFMFIPALRREFLGLSAWARLIHREPAVRGRLIQEVRLLPEPFDADAVVRLPYLEAVCSETLRLNPVAPIIGRTLRKSMTLLGYELPAGISVGAGILLVHRRADLYPEPDRFLPERFLGRSYTPFEYMPFGGGARRCLGAAFALYEMKIVLATILGGYTLRLASAAPVRPAVRNTTVGPRGAS